ncbi:MAG: DUF438 domain-containing protein [Anaerolineaceae bacterium]|nr:DUF438 domain-containing protein [Anaerolineaceae bacterium]
MSEIINNNQERVEIMKSLIRQLHEGETEERVKFQLETMLGETDYSDVFQMEVQLIEEGIPAEKIQELCDAHTRVLKKQLDLQETPETVPGHPVNTFIQENRALTKTTGQVRKMVEKLNEMPDEEDAITQMREIQQQLNNLMDVDKHYRRKENLLFPYLEKNNMSGPPTVMWGKHDEARELMQQTISGLQQTDAMTASEAKAFCQFTVNSAIEAIDDMVYKEEKVLFPNALRILTEQDWYEIYLQSDEYGYCLIAPELEWTPASGTYKEMEKTAVLGGKIQMPTGKFSVEELIGVFSTMPFDMTFVDKNDEVAYFSPGKERTFDRSRAILGRKVQYCHPPRSVHIVNKIVEDFKAGKQDNARFWINMGEKLIYICYYAVQDESGAYMGTLEVTQDLTEIRQLEGERRLLMYDGVSTD